MELYEQILDHIVEDSILRESSKISSEHSHSPLITNEWTVCSECGKVLSQIISEEQEYSGSEEQSVNNSSFRCGTVTNELLGKSMYSTGISGKGRLQVLNSWLRSDYTDTVMYSTLNLFTNVVAHFNIGEYVARESAGLYKKIFLFKIDDKKLINRGKNKKAVLAVCLYEITQNQISLKDIIKYFDIDNTLFEKTLRYLRELKLIGITESKMSEENIHRICNKLGLHIKINTLVCKMYQAVKELEIDISKDPKTAVYTIIKFVLTELGNAEFIKRLKEIDGLDFSALKIQTLQKNKIILFNKIKKH